MKIVYLILCHKDPAQVIRLIECLREEGTFFVVHVDKRAPKSVWDVLFGFSSSIRDIYLSKRCRCYWGGFGIVQATINCIHKALELNRTFDYAVLISGQDYPIKRNALIRHSLQNNPGKQFIESFPLSSKNRWTDNEGMFNALNRVRYWTFSMRNKRIHIKLKRKFPFDWEPFGGSQWWCLSDDCIRYIEAFIRSHSGFVRYFKSTFIPDESFFQTILSNSSYRDKIVSNDMRYADWENPNPNSPRILDDDDFGKLRASCKLFARKFEIGRSRCVLERVDSELLKRGNQARLCGDR